MNFLSNYIKGILIGAGAIIPGISSGVFLLSLKSAIQKKNSGYTILCFLLYHLL